MQDIRYALRPIPDARLSPDRRAHAGAGNWREHRNLSIVDRLLLRPSSFPNGEQLVVLHETASGFRGWMCRRQLAGLSGTQEFDLWPRGRTVFPRL